MKTNEPNDEFFSRIKKLKLYGIIDYWEEMRNEPWIKRLVDIEESARNQRSLDRRVKAVNIHQFKMLSDFDWSWPTEVKREHIESLFTFDFLNEAANVIFAGPSGIGKTMIAQNLAYQTVLKGKTAHVITASKLLNDLASKDGCMALKRRLNFYSRFDLLLIDELGYLSYDNRHADLLFEVINERYLKKSIVITTNKPFAEWNGIFSNASCVVAIIDRLVHRAEIITLAGKSYRYKEAEERAMKTKERLKSLKKRTT